MRLYHMTSFDTATRFILPEKRMRLSRFHKLNDPFELMSWKLEGTVGRKMMKTVVDHFTDEYGLLCTVRHWQSPLMWAHYAQGHEGVCLGFDVPEGVARQISYTNERTAHTIDPTRPFGGITFDDLLKNLTTKSTGWAYEEEWRIFANLKEPDAVNGEYYLPFSESLALREIIVGSRCKAPVGSFRKLLGKVDHSVTIIKARPAFESFTMVRQKAIASIVVNPKGKKPK